MVERAIIFFISVSITAAVLAIRVVKVAILNARKDGVIIELKRIRINTPAVTKVEEWTREETGVGAAIAAGNQAQKWNLCTFSKSS